MPTPALIGGLRDRWQRSISTKLFVLTVVFILLVEAVILVPSIAKARSDWLTARVDAAYLVTVALEAPDERMIKKETAEQLFATAGIIGVYVTRNNSSMPVYAPSIPEAAQTPVAFININRDSWSNMIFAGIGSLFSQGNNTLSVRGSPATAPDETISILVSQAALRMTLQEYALNVLILSLIISTGTAALIYLAFNSIIVRPVKTLTRQMRAFELNPEASKPRARLSNRRDEIGAAEQGLIKLETSIQSLLLERKRLAGLGAGVSKISHDLRNILASAQLMSDRLAKSDDPRVRKLSPRLISSLDRAIALSNETVTYAKMGPDALKPERLDLHNLVAEVMDDTASRHIAATNAVAEDFSVIGDRTHLYRAIFNIVKNASDALAPPDADQAEDGAASRSITVTATAANRFVNIDIIDNGPGLPEAARNHLLDPFKGSSRPGGSGLGIAIAHEIMRAHGGGLRLVKSDESGSVFRLVLPGDSDQ